MTKDEQWMMIAIEEANLATKENEIPVGAIIIQNDKLIAHAHNQTIANNDPTAHAEIIVLRKTGNKFHSERTCLLQKSGNREKHRVCQQYSIW